MKGNWVQRDEADADLVRVRLDARAAPEAVVPAQQIGKPHADGDVHKCHKDNP